MRLLGLSILLSLISIQSLFSQPLKTQINAIAAEAKGTVGVAYLNLNDAKDTLTINNDHHYPMQSVFKFPIALTILDQVDKGKLSLDKIVRVDKKDMVKETWSPMRDKYPNGVDITVREMLSYMVSQSDNIACDVLIGVAGGTNVIEDHIHKIGVKDIAIKATEQQMALAWDIQYKSWCTPSAMMQLLTILYKGSALSKTSNDLLWQMMVSTSTGAKRIKGLLPSGTQVAHRTGTSGTNDKGITAATNDVGIITLPNKKHIALVVFISDAMADEATRESVIAKIAKACYDHGMK